MRHALLIAAIFAVHPWQAAVAQTDYRNLDAGRPLVTEDAYPTARYAFEFTAPFRMERGVREHRFEIAPQLSYGLLRNTMVSIELPWIARTDEGHGFARSDARVSLMLNANTETRILPAVAAKVTAVGVRGVTLTGVATRSFGRMRLHLNVSGTASGESYSMEPIRENRWAASLASDISIWRSSLLLAAEFQIARPIGGVRTSHVGAGVRWQFTPTVVLDLGAYRSHSQQAGRELGLTFGMTHLFGIAALMPKGGK